MNKIQLILGGGLILVASISGSYVGATIKKEQRVSAFSCDTDEQCAALPSCAHKPGCDGSPATQPYRLVGYGCAGGLITFPIYRDEEDEFPAPCKAIEATF